MQVKKDKQQCDLMTVSGTESIYSSSTHSSIYFTFYSDLTSIEVVEENRWWTWFSPETSFDCLSLYFSFFFPLIYFHIQHRKQWNQRWFLNLVWCDSKHRFVFQKVMVATKSHKQMSNLKMDNEKTSPIYQYQSVRQTYHYVKKSTCLHFVVVSLQRLIN